MTTVKRHIQFLVATTDCVIVPGWGGFIASRRPAYVDSERFMPPSRGIVFNPALTHDDGILASSISRREGISYDAARAEIDAEVATMRAEYDRAGRVDIPRVGSFRRLDDGTMLFEPSAGMASAPFAFLPILDARPAITEEPAEENTPHILPRESFAKKILRAAAFAAILGGVALTLTTPISVSLADRPDFASVGATPHAEDATPAAVFHLTIPDSALAVAPVAARPERRPEATEDAKYYLIIGSLDSRARAERWMERHSDYAIGIIERGGRFRVYADTGNTIEEAMAMKSDPAFAAANPEAWVYRRR